MNLTTAAGLSSFGGPCHPQQLRLPSGGHQPEGLACHRAGVLIASASFFDSIRVCTPRNIQVEGPRFGSVVYSLGNRVYDIRRVPTTHKQEGGRLGIHLSLPGLGYSQGGNDHDGPGRG